LETNALTAVIVEKLAAGALPRQKCRVTWFGPGTGNACAACNRPVSRDEIECECEEPAGRIIFMHRVCFEVWDRLRDGDTCATG
jgi:hypothetical protein